MNDLINLTPVGTLRSKYVFNNPNVIIYIYSIEFKTSKWVDRVNPYLPQSFLPFCLLQPFVHHHSSKDALASIRNFSHFSFFLTRSNFFLFFFLLCIIYYNCSWVFFSLSLVYLFLFLRDRKLIWNEGEPPPRPRTSSLWNEFYIKLFVSRILLFLERNKVLSFGVYILIPIIIWFSSQ